MAWFLWDFLSLFLTHIFIWAFSFFCIYGLYPVQFWFHSKKFLLGTEPWSIRTLGIHFESSYIEDCYTTASYMAGTPLLGDVAKPLPVLAATLQLACHAFQLVYVGSLGGLFLLFSCLSDPPLLSSFSQTDADTCLSSEDCGIPCHLLLSNIVWFAN